MEKHGIKLRSNDYDEMTSRTMTARARRTRPAAFWWSMHSAMRRHQWNAWSMSMPGWRMILAMAGSPCGVMAGLARFREHLVRSWQYYPALPEEEAPNGGSNSAKYSIFQQS